MVLPAHLLSTPTDLAKFLIEVMSPKPADNHRLNAATRKAMLRPQIDLPPLDYLQDGRLLKLSWALGWMVIHLENGDVHCHGGDNEGFHSMAAMSLARKSGFVVMNNGESGYEMIEKSLMKDLVIRFV